MERRSRHRVIISLLVLCVLSNAAFSAACFCGNSCLPSPGKNSIGFVFHLKCSGVPCKSCDLEAGQSLTSGICAKNTITPDGFGVFAPPQVITPVEIDLSDKVSVEVPLHPVSPPSPPIYLALQTILR